MRMSIRAQQIMLLVALLSMYGCAGGELDSATDTAHQPADTASGVISSPGKFDGDRPAVGPFANSTETPSTTKEPTQNPAPTKPANDSQPVNDPICPDQEPLSERFPNGPVMRVTHLSIPNTASEAREAGCEFVVQTGSGTGLSSLINLLDFDVNALVAPDENGVIPSILLMHMGGWQPGQTPNQVGTARVGILAGTQVGGGFDVSSQSMASHHDAVISASADVSCGGINSLRSILSFNVPLLDERNVVPLVVEASHIRGELTSGEQGVSVTRGTINGYLRRDALESVLHGLNAACRQTPAPEVCNGADTLIEGDISSIVDQYVIPFLGGLDARLDASAQTVSACDDDDCNAMTVCILFETEPVALSPNGAQSQ